MKRVKRAKIKKPDSYHIFEGTRLDEVTAKRLKNEAEKRDIPRGKLIRIAIERLLNDNKQPA